MELVVVYAVIAAGIGFFGGMEALCASDTTLTVPKVAAASTLWPLAVLILSVRGCREWIEEDQHRRRLEKAKRRRELEEEYQKAIEELEVGQ